MCQLHRMPSGGLSCSCVDVTVEIIVFSSSQFLDMCSVPTVAVHLPGMEKVFRRAIKVTEINCRRSSLRFCDTYFFLYPIRDCIASARGKEARET